MNSSWKQYLTQRPLAMAGLVVSLAVLLICQLGKTSAPVTRTIANSVADTSTTATSLSLDKHSLPDNASDLLLKLHQRQPEIELVPIEQIKVGMRVPALNPEVTAEERATFKDPDPATWQLMELEHQKPDGGVLLISMLRPIEWIHQQGIHSGGSFQIDMPELGAKGQAKVVALKPCPEIQSGPGHVVLSTFAHPATHEILDVTIGQGEDAETIGVTETHPFWSVQDQAFVPVGHLVAGSQVLTADKQTKTITSILPRPGPAQQVYNLEVNGEHVYYVGQQQLLVHNDGCFDIALGLKQTREGEAVLDKLKGAAAANADWVGRGLADNGPFVKRFYQATYRSIQKGGRVKFYLDKMNIEEALEIGRKNGRFFDPFDVDNSFTAWELQQVMGNQLLRKNTDFILDGKVLNMEELKLLGIKW